MTKRLGEDHARAKKLADGLRQVDGLVLDTGSPYTNMVYFDLANHVAVDVQQITQRMKERGILVDPESARRFRLVTHCWIDDEAVGKVVAAFTEALR